MRSTKRAQKRRPTPSCERCTEPCRWTESNRRGPLHAGGPRWRAFEYRSGSRRTPEPSSGPRARHPSSGTFIATLEVMRAGLARSPAMWPAWVSAFSACVVFVDDPRDERTYEICLADHECPGEAACMRINVAHVAGSQGARMCTRTCEDGDCPAGGACVLAASGRSVCLARCADDDDCHERFACASYQDDGVCFPL